MSSKLVPLAPALARAGWFGRFNRVANPDMDRIVHEALRFCALPPSKEILRIDYLLRVIPNALPLRVAAFCEDIGVMLPGTDLDALREGIKFADTAFGEKSRCSGERYVVHPLAVAEIFGIEWGLPLLGAIKAMLFHDTPEDTAVTLQEIRGKYGDEVAEIVDGMTKVRSTYEAKDVTLAKTYRKIIGAMGKNVVVGIGKLADRLHNMRTLNSMPLVKQARIAQETFDVYVPIAKALGMMDVAEELERLAFRYLYPDDFRRIEAWMAINNVQVQEQRFKKVLLKLREKVAQYGGSVEVVSRTSWELFKLCRASGLELNEISIIETPLVRIILPESHDCYSLLPKIYSFAPPCQGTFRDYISIPNGFHQALEVWVRDWSPEEENGILRLEIFPENRRVPNRIGLLSMDSSQWQTAESLWLANLANLIEELPEADRAGIIEAIKHSGAQIAVYSPHGAEYLLAPGSSAADYAYAVHQKLGAMAVRAIVFGREGVKDVVRKVPLGASLERGRVVWVVTKNGTIPDFRLIFNLGSADARKKMRSWMGRATAPEADENVRNLIFAMVEEAVDAELESCYISLDQIIRSADICSTFFARINSSFSGEISIREDGGATKRVALVVNDKNSLLRAVAMGFVAPSFVVEAFKNVHSSLCIDKERLYHHGRLSARIRMVDQPGELAKITWALGAVGINIDQFNQPGRRSGRIVVSSIVIQFFTNVHLLQIYNILEQAGEIISSAKTNPFRKSKQKC
ncbi:MAG: HD domain-containing protein [Candidatus Margulisiibacteriota bacterium]